jgi:hypothetical protein
MTHSFYELPSGTPHINFQFIEPDIVEKFIWDCSNKMLLVLGRIFDAFKPMILSGESVGSLYVRIVLNIVKPWLDNFDLNQDMSETELKTKSWLESIVDGSLFEYHPLYAPSWFKTVFSGIDIDVISQNELVRFQCHNLLDVCAQFPDNTSINRIRANIEFMRLMQLVDVVELVPFMQNLDMNDCKRLLCSFLVCQDKDTMDDNVMRSCLNWLRRDLKEPSVVSQTMLAPQSRLFKPELKRAWSNEPDDLLSQLIEYLRSNHSYRDISRVESPGIYF